MELKDEELVARAQEDDKKAVDELFNRYLQKAYAAAYSICSGDKYQAQDLTQEAFLKVLRNIKTFRGNSSFFTWLHQIMVNTYLDGFRHRRKWKQIFSFRRRKHEGPEPSKDLFEEHPDGTDYSNPVMVLRGKQFGRDVRKALKLLPEKQRIVFQFKVLHEMSIREISQIMGIAEGTVKSHLFRATCFLQKALHEWEM